MTFQDFRKKWARRYRDEGPSVIPRMCSDFAVSALGHLASSVGYGTNVYDREWDILIILDGCRHDMYQELIRPCPGLTSVGTASTEWLANTFTEDRADEMSRTAYITGNGYSHQLDPDAFGLLDETWLYARDDERGTMPPGPLTDRAITAARSGEYDRIIVHYMQPHYPFLSGPVSGTTLDFQSGFGMGDGPRDEIGIWKQISEGQRDPDPVIESYRANLDYVWPHVERVLNNVDGTVAISADHGNSLGEWGIWGHKVGIPTRGLVRVPWDVRECTDSKEYEPDTYSRSTRDDVADVSDAVTEHLADLGYHD